MRILIIEDDKELSEMIRFQLNTQGYYTDLCHTGEDALYYALKQAYDIIILDRMLPCMDGLTILNTIRDNHIVTPVIMVTAMSGIDDRIDGLDAGADDYLVKPFAVEELLARIRALGRRPQKITSNNKLACSDLCLDVNEKTLIQGEKACSLSKRETELFEFFFKNQGQVLTREVILSHVWGGDVFVEDGNIDNYIYFLRRRMDAVASRAKIKTIRGVGYRLEE